MGLCLISFFQQCTSITFKIRKIIDFLKNVSLIKTQFNFTQETDNSLVSKNKSKEYIGLYYRRAFRKSVKKSLLP